MKQRPPKWRPPAKQKTPAAFTDYLLREIRKIRTAATLPKTAEIQKSETSPTIEKTLIT